MLALVIGVVALFIFGQSPALYRSDYGAAVLPTVLIDLTNADREAQAIGSLRANPLLDAAAQAKADDMASKGYFAHTSPEGKTPWYWISTAGYRYAVAGENLAVGFFESQDVETAWMNSVGHRANILNNHFTEIGIATARGNYQGSERLFVVQMFGKPAMGAVATAIPVPAKSTTPTSAPAEPIRASTTPITPLPTTVLSETVTAPTPIVSAAVNETFISVESPASTSSLVATTQPATPKPISLITRLRSEPRLIINIAYLILMLLVALVLLAVLRGEIKKHHVKHIIYGVAALLVLVLFIYLNRSFIAADILVL